MSVRVTGVLTDAGGNIAPNVHIQFTTTQGFGSTLPTAPLDVITGADGGYDFNLVIGTHRISIRYGDRFEPIGTTVINDETPGVLTLSELLKQTAPVTPEALKLIMQYTAEAKAAKEEAGQFAAQAEENAEQSLVEATKSKQHADQAKIYRDQTAEIATGGTATLEPEPGKIPLADQHGHIDDGWLNAATFARSESDMMADRARNNQLFAASGHIHAGKHRNDVNPVYGRPIQDGLWTYLNNSNVLRLGAYKELSSVEGDSKTYESVFNLSGVTAHLKGLNSAYENAQLTLPPAPKGTEVYDSDTGVLTNFETDIDPKYGDVAADTNEAVKRAFGLVRLDDSGLNEVRVASGTTTYDYATQAAISSGSGTGVIFYNLPLSRNKLTARLTSTKTVTIEIRDGTTGTESSPIMHTISLNANEETVLDLDLGSRTKEQIYFRLVSSSDYPVSIQYSEVSITNEVVTHPVDLVGLEVFLRPINEADPFACPYGMEQSKLTSVDGIPTVENNVRPITHFEVYPGDTTSRGRGWNLLDGSLTDAQKAKILQNPAHNIYRMNDGTLAQWTVSQRTIRGAGNGDWEAIFASGSGDLSLCYKNKPSGLVTARGALDAALSASYSNSYRRPARVSLNSNDLGIWKLIETNAASVAKNNECYFYVITTVPRLNQGAYHPVWNPKGTASGWKNNGSGRAPWHDPLITQFVSPASCFKSSNDSSGADGGYDPTTGKLGGRTDRPDGLLHDVIYASGLNGVIDHRPKYGAWNASSAEQAAVVREEVKSGKYRGREKLKRWMISEGVPSASSSNMYIGSGFGIGDGEVYLASKSVVDNGYKAWVYIVDAGDTTLSGVVTGEWYVCTAFSRNYQGQVTLLNPITGNNTWITAGTTASMKIIIGIDVEVNATVEGGFTQTDVIGAPANIFQVEALKEGWLGGWIKDIPDGTAKGFTLTRRNVGNTSINRVYSPDNGASWVFSTIATSEGINTFNSAYPLGAVSVVNYTAFAAQTEPSSNLPVFNGERGLSSVFASSNYRTPNGCLLSESLLSNLLKSDSTLPRDKCYSLTGFAVASSGVLEPSGNMTTHSQIDLSAPTSGDKAFKALFCQYASDQQANLNIIANELIYSSTGGNWGDDAKVKIVADGTFTDLNGNKCKAAIHKLAKPYGFIKM
ncbi:prophage tail fiber N-terminal domain-containing protein [Vibrio fluvialis]|nr:prophage tail fiber N-terminal domain-containing protein [Vibrio fluvialis]